jgi:hypothetical protein
MSSFVRRLQRQVVGTKFSFVIVDGKGKYVEAPPRGKFYQGRGEKLGVTNPNAADLIARQKRIEARNQAA